MKKIIEYKLADGASVLVEVDDPAPEEILPASSTGEVAEKAQELFEQALSRIKPAAAAIVATLRELGDSPDEATVEFGVKLVGKSGVIFASAEAEANFVFKLTWKRKPEPGQP
jgi:hypothetical protein